MVMVNIAWKPGSPSDVADYFLNPDYYLDEGKGTWDGQYAASRGFTGEVNRTDLRNLLLNRTPKGEKLTQRDAKEPRTALELVLSAPKSFSIMAELSGDTRLPQAWLNTQHAVMKLVEQDAMRRVRAGGQNTDVYTGNLIYAMFPQRLARPVKQLIDAHLLGSTSLTPVRMAVPDMQWHSHVLIGNATRDPDNGKWYALQADQIFRNQHFYEMFARMHLAKQLEAMGYRIDYSKGGWEIHGISRELIDKFSQRHHQIDKEAEERGQHSPESRTRIARMSREKKTDQLTWDDLQRLWAARLTPQEAQQIRDTYLNSLNLQFPIQPDFSAKYTDKAIDKLTRMDTWVPERKVITHAMREGLGKVSYEGIVNHISYRSRFGGVVRRKRQLTTDEALQKQHRVIDMWKAGMGKYEKLGRDLYTVKDPPHIRALAKLPRDKYMSVRGSIFRQQAYERAKKDLRAQAVRDVNNPPDGNLWFVEKKIPDADMLTLMEKAEEQDARIVFWGDKDRSELEERLRLEPVKLFETKPVEPKPSRLKEALLYLIQRGRDAIEQIKQPEPRRERTAEYQW